MAETWAELAAEERRAPFQQALARSRAARAAGRRVYPPEAQVFAAFRCTDFAQVKLVILGQDPYHGAGQAHGLAFSVCKGVDTPPSLRNIYKELAADIAGFALPRHGCLQDWAEQGVLLLNTVLTVEEGQANSHQSLGWQGFTDAVIKTLSDRRDGLIFLLWGKPAQEKARLIDAERHFILRAPHPSPLSAYRGFFGCKHFSQANRLLAEQGKAEIDWRLA